MEGPLKKRHPFGPVLTKLLEKGSLYSAGLDVLRAGGDRPTDRQTIARVGWDVAESDAADADY